MIYRDQSVPYAFFHNPRTSGTSLEKFLLEYCGGVQFRRGNEYSGQLIKHRVYADVHHLIKDHYKFGFVRNPFSREVSLYKLIFPKQNISFKEWIIGRYTEQLPDKFAKHILWYRFPQYGYFCDLDGKLQVNVFKYEHRSEALSVICRHIGVNPGNIAAYRPVQNSPRFDINTYHDLYDNEMIDSVNNALRVDLENFGYNFDGDCPVVQNNNFRFYGDVKHYASNYESEEQYNQYIA